MTTPVGAQAAALGPRRRSPCLATAADASARLRKCPAEAGLVEDMVQACRTSRPTKRDATETREVVRQTHRTNGERRDWFLRRKSDSGSGAGVPSVTAPALLFGGSLACLR